MHGYLMTCSTGASAFNAGAKAPADINAILAREGFDVLTNNYMLRNRKFRLPLILITPLAQSVRIRRGSQLFFQHPYDTAHDAIKVMNKILLRLLRCKNVTTVVLVHDIESIRFGEKPLADEVALLNSFDTVIAHSPAMKSLLEANGLKVPCKVLGLFDYLVTKTNVQPRTRDGGVCYAGNLEKSTFISALVDVAIPFHLYGSASSNIPVCKNVAYEGRFASDDLSSLKGGWGLVWDGDGMTRCSGTLGDYLAYNSPHKASMYLCAGLPLIVPSWSAVASIVRDNGLGIVVDNLKQVQESIASITEDEYKSMLVAVSAYADDLMHGRHILEVI